MSSTRAAQPHTAGQSSEPALVYLYAVLPADGGAAERLAAGAIHGLVEGAPLFAIAAAGLCAAVSLVPAAQFDEAPLAELLADLPRLTPLAVRHENAVHALAEASAAIVPISFGALYRDAGAVARLLRDGADRFYAALARVRGRQEWGITLFAEPAALARAAEAASDGLRRLDAEIAAAGPGRAYLLGKRREQALTAEVERQGVSLAGEILQRLTPLSAETWLDVAALASGAPRLLLKAAFLVESDEADSFLAEAAAIERECRQREFSLLCSGPWAPYSFATSAVENATDSNDTIAPAMEARRQAVTRDGGAR